jgi:hypothetical protein
MYQKSLITLALALACCASLAAQTYGYNYQAVVRDGSGQPLKNQTVSLQFQILRSPTQVFNPAYAETHNGLTTDQFGLVTAVIGKGTDNFGRFDTIGWNSGPRYLKVLIKTPGNGDFKPLGEAKEIVHAPFAGGGEDWVNVKDTILYTSKKVGIGISAPQQALDISGGVRMKTDWPSLTFENNNGKKMYWEMSPSGKLYLFDPTTNFYRIAFDEPGRMGVKTSSPEADLDINGSLRSNYLIVDGQVDVGGPLYTKCLTILGGCDVYELSQSTEKVRPGEVVRIDPSGPTNSVRRSQKAYDKMATGVVSGAGGVNPGIGLRQEGKLEGDTPVALAGKVSVYVTGKVRPGDLLTSSAVPGRAMAVKNRRKAFGAVIGKALTAPDAEGLVLVLVMMR